MHVYCESWRIHLHTYLHVRISQLQKNTEVNRIGRAFDWHTKHEHLSSNHKYAFWQRSSMPVCMLETRIENRASKPQTPLLLSILQECETTKIRTFSGSSVKMLGFYRWKHIHTVKWKNIPSSLLITNTEQTYQCHWKSSMLMQKASLIRKCSKMIIQMSKPDFGDYLLLHLTCKCNYSNKSE